MSSSSTTVCASSPWRRKRSMEGDSGIESKRPLTNYFYFRLESESSAESADDTESIYSIQDKETDIAKDTTDTETKSEYEVEIEYDIASLSGSDRDDFNIAFGSSSGSSEEENPLDNHILLAASLACESSLENFVTDVEDSDTSRQEDSSSGLTDFWTCIRCKSQNDNPQFRYCDKCFQDRKMFFPPRPRRRRKRTTQKPNSPVKLTTLRSCLSGLSQDSGIGSGQSSQEFPSLNFDKIVVPDYLHSDQDKPSTSAAPPLASQVSETPNRKRQISESSLSEDYEIKRPKRPKFSKKEECRASVVSGKDSEVTKPAVVPPLSPSVNKAEDKERTTPELKGSTGPLPECKELCIMCNTKPKSSIFIHGRRIAHMCCCYPCAMRTWKTCKRCPICKRKVSNVVKVVTY